LPVSYYFSKVLTCCMNDAIKIVIADHHECSVLGMETFLATHESLHILGLAKNDKELIHLAESCNPRIIITDIEKPVLNGIRGVMDFIKTYSHIDIIVYTGYQEMYVTTQLVQAGVKACVSKSSHIAELFLAIQSVNEGNTYFCPGTQHKLAQAIKKKNLFTKSQLEILPYICQGKSDAEIAVIFFKSPRTIEMHRANIKQRLGVKTNAEIINYSLANGYYTVMLD
jgi:two-component system, NarL family, response regulator NreC